MAVAVTASTACGGGVAVQPGAATIVSTTTSVVASAAFEPTSTVTTSTPAADPSIGEAVQRFAVDASASNFAAIPFGQGPVRLVLGPYVVASRTPQELVDPRRWRIAPDSRLGGDYAQYEFAPLVAVAAASTVSITIGPHSRCANPPTAAPAGTEQLAQISIQPVAVASCLSWFAVDLFVRDGRIEAVRFDQWGP